MDGVFDAPYGNLSSQILATFLCSYFA